MFTIIILIIIILLALYLIYSKIYTNDNLVLVNSNITNEEFWVRDKIDKQQAANTLATIKINMVKLVDYLKVNIDKFPENMSYIKDLVSRTKVINIMETPADEKYTSYTVNKGQKVVLCLRSKLLEDIHDMNTIMYVVIHEMAHIGCPEYGHTPLFKSIFKFLLEQSIVIGIYDPIDYRFNPQPYCGMVINEYILD